MTSALVVPRPSITVKDLASKEAPLVNVADRHVSVHATGGAKFRIIPALREPLNVVELSIGITSPSEQICFHGNEEDPGASRVDFPASSEEGLRMRGPPACVGHFV
jgi:hypothetical protein